jgi:exopolysaccharide biosynthesis polyprenyl glycosylphosphotransferase
MYRQQFYIINNFLMVMDSLIVIVTGYLAYSMSLDMTANGLVMGWYDFLGSVLFLMFANNYFMGRFGFYSAKRFPSVWSMINNLSAAVALGFFVLTSGVVLLGITPFAREYLVIHFGSVLISLIAVRVFLHYYMDNRARTTFNSRQILLIGSPERIGAVADALEKQRSWGHQVAGCLALSKENINDEKNRTSVLGMMEDFNQIVREREIDEVIFALPKGSPLALNDYLEKCKRIGVTVRVVPALFDPLDPTLRVDTIQGIPTLTDYTAFRSASALLYKKILDLVVGFVGFVLFLVLYPIIGLAIKLDSSGPILFKQTRVGMHNRRFPLYKFRSMRANADDEKAKLLEKQETPWPSLKTKLDPRITKVGRVLRKTSLDELPQFINELKREMSLVGTRPPTPEEVKYYEDWHRRRISIKPGMTGLWQISGRKEITDFAEVVKLDLQYIDGWVFRKDLVILWKTLWVVLARKGAK